MSNQPDAGAPVILTVSDGVARLCLNRPEVGNAIGMDLARALNSASRQLAATPDLQVVILEATGRMFCAGGDVREMAGATDRSAFLDELAGQVHEALLGLAALPVPIIASIQGAAAGGGLGLVLAADLAIAADTARFTSAYTRIGLSPDCGVSLRLPYAVGSRRAAAMSLTNQSVTAAEAVEWGLINASCPAEVLLARTMELALAVSTAPASGQTAWLLRTERDRHLAAHLDTERRSIAELGAGAATAALIEQFVQAGSRSRVPDAR